MMLLTQSPVILSRIYLEEIGMGKKVAGRVDKETHRKIGYARVSTADQNPDLQIQALKDYGVPEHRIFVDRASGGSLERPNLIRRFLD